MSLNILSPGLLTTIQDLGRYGYQKDGMVVSGAMDPFALRAANLLVGNEEGEASIEITLQGAKIFFPKKQLIAITGADLSPTINRKPVKGWRPLLVEEGSILEFGAPRSGCRAYIAVAGGFDLPAVLGSKSTYLRGGIGGLSGRALQRGDTLLCRDFPAKMEAFLRGLTTALQENPLSQANWSVDVSLQVTYDGPQVVRVVRGPEYLLFSEQSLLDFWQLAYQVTAQSDRMGYRLLGTRLALASPEELISSAVTFGTVQVPPDGNPIVLMADHQTTGGYPRIAQVISADFSKLAQLVPRHKIHFKEVTLEEAQALYIRQEKNLEKIRAALHFKTKP
ncbi:biotin-dependent carboxyltransferase family protein [Pontibacter sp. E15-1]|uniref:5-oxoprolinase subunit C family protein n=1 Tax=Pontibacter sp. E15-1 TaxID=2919918 RepID=UPI001F4F793E|nr:biotin-dependent carboxyltransferase family protein [Pontibacter sp. E15-1]MCJ8163419.1 biotin-dependent carboxyltransferase family protein [Pontibacter sp. E15-1]